MSYSLLRGTTCLIGNDRYKNRTLKLEVKLEYWVPGITTGASGAREENSLRDFTLEKLYDRWAIMLVTLI